MRKPASVHHVGMWGSVACAFAADNTWAAVLMSVIGLLHFIASCVDEYRDLKAKP